jgi:hypothetical protein
VTATAKTAIDPSALAGMIPGAEDEQEVSIQAQAAPSFASPAVTPPMPQLAPDPGPAPSAPNGSGKRLGRVSQAKPATAKQQLASMMPSALRIHVYKRQEDGSLGFAKDYAAVDLFGAGTIEAFLRKYVIPEYDFGEYHLYQHDGTSGQQPVGIGSIKILAPVKHHSDGSTGSKVESMKELFEVAKMMQPQQQPQIDPLEQMTKMMGMMRGFVSSDANGKPGGFDPMLMMMMFFFMQSFMGPKPQQQTGPDPITMKILERLERMEDERMTAALIPPALPPAPPLDPMQAMRPVIEMMQQNTQIMLESLRGSSRDRDPVRDLADLSKLLVASKGDTITMKDMLAMMPQLKDMMLPRDVQKDPFEKTIENFRLFKMIQHEFAGGRDPAAEDREAASGFWDFAKSFLMSDLAGGLANAIQSGNSAAQVDQRVRQRQRNIAETAQQVARDRGAPQPPRHAQQAPNGARPPAPPQAQPEDDSIEIPEVFITSHAPKINQAATDAERVAALVNGLRTLATMSADFRPHIVEVFGLAKQNRRAESMEKLAEVLGALAEAQVLELRAVELSISDFDKHWNLIRNRLGMPDIPEVGPDGKPVDVPADGVQTAPAPEAPRPVPETEDEEVDEDEKPVERPRRPAPARARPRPAMPREETTPAPTAAELDGAASASPGPNGSAPAPVAG